MEIVQIKFNEQFVIQIHNESVVIGVGDDKGTQEVVFLIDAPRHVAVDREEIAHLKKKNNQTNASAQVLGERQEVKL